MSARLHSTGAMESHSPRVVVHHYPLGGPCNRVSFSTLDVGFHLVDIHTPASTATYIQSAQCSYAVLLCYLPKSRMGVAA